MKITWLGQAGLLMETDEAKVIIDPYLSNSVEKIEPKNYRRVPVDESFFKVEPDFLLFTHNHLDHYDPESAEVYLKMDKEMVVLCPSSVWSDARKYGGDKNYVRFDRGSVWTEKGLRITAVKAEHSDDFAVGYIIEELSDGKKYYVTGDTLYNNAIFADIPADIYAIFLPVNGKGNNMNMADGVDFVKRCGAKYSVPYHCGLFDNFKLSDFGAENKIIPEFYKEIKFPG